MEFWTDFYELIHQNCGEPPVIVFFVLTVACGLYKLIGSYRKRRRNREFQVERSVKKLFRGSMNSADSLSNSRRGSNGGKQKDGRRSMKPESRSALLDECFSSGEEDELDTGANLRFEKLRIGSPGKRNNMSNRSNSPTFYPCEVSSPVIFSSSSGRSETAPLWKDYPMVEKAVPSGYSYCSMPVSSPYSNGGFSSPFHYRNYRSSSTATIFGGPKPLLSPPKLDVGCTPGVVSRPDSSLPSVYSCHSSHGRSWGYNSTAENLLGPYMTSPLSRSSSQSSGFISQKGPNTPPPSSVNNLPTSHLSPDGREADALSVYSDPNSCTGPSRPFGSNYHNGFVPYCSLSNHSFGRSELNLNTGRIWSPSAFSAASTIKPVSMVNRSLNGNTCSRFARRDSDTNLFMKRLIDIRSASSNLYSEDEDADDGVDDTASFKSAFTSLTRATKHDGSRHVDSNGSKFATGSNSVRSRSSVRKLGAECFDESRSGTEKTEKLCAGRSNDGVTSDLPEPVPTFWSLMKQIFWSVSLFFNVVIILFLVFCGSSTVFLESSQQLYYNVSDTLVTNAPVYWNYLQEAVLELLAVKEVASPVLLLNEEL